MSASSLPTDLFFFLLVSFLVTFVISATRWRDPGRIWAETRRFFVTVVLVVLVFAAVIFLLEWVFIRPLI